MERQYDLFALDRLVADIAAKLESVPNGLPREASSKATYDDLSELRGDPLADGLRSWVGHLTVLRVTAADARRVASTRDAPDHLAPSDGPRVSVRDLAREVAGVPADFERWVTCLADAAPAARDAVVVLAERRVEATRRLGIADLGEVEHPPFTRAEVDEAASTALGVTDEVFAAEVGEGDARRSFEIALARDAGEGWPAHLTERWVQSLFRGPLTEGLTLSLGDLPRPLGASSFARALGRFGMALGRADMGRSQPMALLRGPEDPLHHARAALFAKLTFEPAFHRRKLGLDPPRARAEARRVGRAGLAWCRLSAARALTWRALSEATPWPDRVGTASDLFLRASGAPLDRGLVGVLPLPSPSAGASFAGMLHAFATSVSLREQFDEDWFDNPRALESLRHEHHATTLARGYGKESLAAGSAAFAKWARDAFT